MVISDWITIVAIILGPILAVQAQKFIERSRESKNRRITIFKTLMASRGTQLSLSHVEALNRIDLEFPEKGKYKKVSEAWKKYFDHLTDKEYGKDVPRRWNEKQAELLTVLLFDMGKALGYSFNEVQIKRNIYFPSGHQKIEDENIRIREALLSIFEGDKKLPIAISSSEPTEEQIKIQKLLLDHYEGKIALKIEILNHEK